MIILRNKLFAIVNIPGVGGYSFDANQLQTISSQTGMSRANVIKTMNSDPTFAKKYVTAGTPYTPINPKTTKRFDGRTRYIITDSNGRDVGIRTREHFTKAQMHDFGVMARGGEFVNKYKSFEGTANYTQPTTVNAPGVYRNNAFTLPKNKKTLNRFKEAIKLGKRI